jgi:hypothetical protein
MTFFNDLDECSYFEDLKLPRVIAVGWLENGRPLEEG